MQGAFVIRLGRQTNPSVGHFAGSVEEVDSGKELKFQSSTELLKFLGECFRAAFEERSQEESPIELKNMSEPLVRPKKLKQSSSASRGRRQ